MSLSAIALSNAVYQIAKVSRKTIYNINGGSSEKRTGLSSPVTSNECISLSFFQEQLCIGENFKPVGALGLGLCGGGCLVAGCDEYLQALNIKL